MKTNVVNAFYGTSVESEKRIAFIKTDVDPTDETDWHNQHEWLANKFEKLNEVFRPRIERAEYKVSSEQPDLEKVLEKINEIARKSAEGDYIYRGEAKYHKKVSSSLYREFPDLDSGDANIARTQEIILEAARAYIGQTDDIDETDHIGLLTEIQHFGGKTNLIDFTEDFHIALFFACNGSHKKDGRVILLKRESEDYKIKKPRRTINRVESQRSVFVESTAGFVTPDIKVRIPADLKFAILDYLKKHHRISIATLYNDLHGFITQGTNTEILRGLTCERKASAAETNKKKYELLEEAIKHYTEALKLRPVFIMYLVRGNACHKRGDFDAAIRDYNAAIALNSENARVYNDRGNAYYEKGSEKGDFLNAFFDTAIDDYSKSIELNSKDAGTYKNRGITYVAKNESDAAIKDLNKTIELDPEDANAYKYRGKAYRHKCDFDAAIDDFTQTIELAPEDANAYYSRGDAYLYKGMDLNTGKTTVYKNHNVPSGAMDCFQAAIDDFTQTIELAPEDANAYKSRGGAYYNTGDFEAVIKDFTKAMELDPEAALYQSRGIAYHNIGDFHAAIDDYSKMIILYPEDPTHYNKRGEAWLHLSKWEEAMADLTTAKSMGGDIVAFFHWTYESVEAFEAKTGITLPKDIAALLQQA